MVTSACLPPVRKVTVNDERRGEDFKAQIPFIQNCRLCYMHCNMTTGTNLPTPPPRLSTEKRYYLTTPSAGTLNLTPNRSVWCRKRMKAQFTYSTIYVKLAGTDNLSTHSWYYAVFCNKQKKCTRIFLFYS
jgi:hypothetical protein